MLCYYKKRNRILTKSWRCNTLECITAPFSTARLWKTPDPDVLQNFWHEKFCQFFSGSAWVQPPQSSLSKHSSLQWPCAHLNASPLLSVSIGRQLKQTPLVPLSQPFDPSTALSSSHLQPMQAQTHLTWWASHLTHLKCTCLLGFLWYEGNRAVGEPSWKCGRVNCP